MNQCDERGDLLLPINLTALGVDQRFAPAREAILGSMSTEELCYVLLKRTRWQGHLAYACKKAGQWLPAMVAPEQEPANPPLDPNPMYGRG